MLRIHQPRVFSLLAGTALALSSTSVGCASDLRPQNEENQEREHSEGNQHASNQERADDEEGDPRVVHQNEEAFTVTTIDARNDSDMVKLNMLTREVDSQEWHLGFRRFQIYLNSGDSGPGEVALTWVDDAVFEDLTVAPSGTYFVDRDDEVDEFGQNFGLAIQRDGGWYDYDQSTHTLSPRERVFFVYLEEEEFLKLEFLDYYDQAGTSGFLSFRWAFVAPQLAR